MSEPNILLLDEPTNDLDVQTLTILESYLDEFPGAVIAVSHDRYFLDRVVDKIFSFEGNGIIKQYTGNYSDYSESIRNTEAQLKENNSNIEADKGKNNTGSVKDKPLKFTFKEQKEFEQIDSVIEALENDLKDVSIGIDQASSDYALLQELLAKKERLESRLGEAMERWEYLNELAERILNNKKQI
jgi:ATP-binding cassette subfamily F protein uup